MTDGWRETRARSRRVSREGVTQRQTEAGPATAHQTRLEMTQGLGVTPGILYLMCEGWGLSSREQWSECSEQTMEHGGAWVGRPGGAGG